MRSCTKFCDSAALVLVHWILVQPFKDPFLEVLSVFALQNLNLTRFI